ncbi:MAG: type II toxin-antitoxin system RelE/ParE family toxin [Desulfatirhabdiaceae bacterium]
MTEFRLLISPAALRDLKKLPIDVQNKIVYEHLPAIERDPMGVGRPLYGALKGELSYHFGRKPEYRLIYYVENEIITITIIGSRENLYKRAKKRYSKT